MKQVKQLSSIYADFGPSIDELAVKYGALSEQANTQRIDQTNASNLIVIISIVLTFIILLVISFLVANNITTKIKTISHIIEVVPKSATDLVLI
ncbi:MAG: hypothetical protein HRU28_04760 [Rhizobiales bacterium]|nr:hypothetical protein [Hyphomicrobiales bacterium]